MSFSVDQFMQVKCTFQLTSESDSSESIVTNNEQIRLCTSATMEDNNSALIVMVCTNETGNNHVLAYYIEHRQHSQQQPLLSKRSTDANLLASNSIDQSQAINDDSTSKTTAVTFANLAAQSKESPFRNDSVDPAVKTSRKVKTKPRVIVKQIYYHDYNEDIVAICLSKQGTKLVLVNASSTVYVIPIKNILLNLHAQQLRSSQGRSMYFYDASILYCAQSFADPVDVVYWESPEIGQHKSTIIIASHDGRLIFLSVGEKRVVSSTSVGEPIKSIKVIRDKHSYSLLITCKSLNQYRQSLELLDKSIKSSSQHQKDELRTIISLPQSLKSRKVTQKQVTSIEEQARQAPSWSSRPLPIKPLSHHSGAASAANALQRVLLPSGSRFGSQASLMSNFNDVRERSLSIVGYQEPNLISLVDVLGPKSAARSNHHLPNEPRLLRFYSDKQYFYQPQRPQIICKLDSLDPDELITELILTDRFIALTTDRDRCIVNSRNCSKLKNAFNVQQQDLNPLVKEITFNHEEKIMLLIRSPTINDPDNIIDSFLLVTTRSIYSIEARHGCRELFINLIDSHLAIKRTLFMSRPRPELDSPPYTLGRMISSASENHLEFGLNCRARNYETRNAESNLLIGSFLQHRDAYERVCHDSKAFSTLFKVELSSLYEAYADRLLQRGQLELADRFFQMASFDHIKILGKYIRIGAYKETIDYVKDLLDDENNFRAGMLGESERIELAKMAFECLLAKTIVERSKILLYKTRASRSFRSKLLNAMKSKLKPGQKQPPDIQQQPAWSSPALRGLNPFSLCEHSLRGQDAKLSATTIVPSGQDDEDTLTSNTAGRTVDQGNNNSRIFRPGYGDRTRLECEKSLLHFMQNLMPTSMFEYTIDQLLDFDLIEFIDLITQADIQILSFIKMVIRYRDEDRLVFRAGRFQPLIGRLARINQTDLVKVSIEKDEFLEFLTSPKVTRALVKDIGLTCEYYGYQHTRVQFRKYSFAALRHLETYRQLVRAQSERAKEPEPECENKTPEVDDNANDGFSFGRQFDQTSKFDDGRTSFSQDQKQNVENIFIEFLMACLDRSIEEDSCRLWYSYINFYLNYVGSLEDLQSDILRLVDTTGDCRLAKSLYQAIHRDELLAKEMQKNSKKKPTNTLSNFKISRNVVDSKAFLKENVIANTPLEHMKKLHSLTNLFKNGFLMKLLEKTLDLMPHSADLH